MKGSMEITEQERESHMHRKPLREELFSGELHVHKDWSQGSGKLASLYFEGEFSKLAWLTLKNRNRSWLDFSLRQEGATLPTTHGWSGMSYPHQGQFFIFLILCYVKLPRWCIFLLEKVDIWCLVVFWVFFLTSHLHHRLLAYYLILPKHLGQIFWYKL